MKPTREDIERQFHGSSVHEIIGRVMEVIDRAWEEREPLTAVERSALSRFVGDFNIGWFSDLSKDEAQALRDAAYSALRKIGALDHDLPTVDEVVGVLSEARLADDLEQHNREQRIRREAYEAGYKASRPAIAFSADEAKRSAACAYPLRKRVPKVIPDPHGVGEWRAVVSHKQAEVQWRCGDAYPEWSHPVGALTFERVRAHAALLDDPWTYEESTEVEP